MKTLFVPAMALMLSLLLTSCSHQDTWDLSSPSGELNFVLHIDEEGRLYYTVNASGEMLISPSTVGIKRFDEDFSKGLKFNNTTEPELKNETFDLVTGKRLKIAAEWNERTVSFLTGNKKEMQLMIRMYDDGVAFRYFFPGSGDGLYTVEEELTGFAFSSEGRTWIQPYDKVTTYSPAYETYFENGIPIGTDAPSKEGWSFPALMQTGEWWILLTEAAASSGYFAAHLNQDCSGRTYTVRMPEEEEALGLVPQKASSTLPWITPWRVLIIDNSLAGIVESDMVAKLNPPSEIADVSWIKPGKASWSWWGDWPSPRDGKKLMKFVDLAVEMGWEYSLVDANWDLMENGSIEDVVKYANSKGIGIFMWYNSGGAHNEVTERPRNIISDPELRKQEFRKLSEWGVKGVKVDFFQSDKQQIIAQYFDILKDAADNRIMVNFHGCTLPRGWNRTWPNLMSMEAVRGAECYAFDEKFPANAVWYNTILPFTRNAVGSMDYTPVTFTDQKYPHLTTWGHELALSVVFESGILHMADRVEAYLTLPGDIRHFLSKVPAAWDETKFLAGEPGKFCVIARKSGNSWYIGGINGTNETMDLSIDISVLTDNKTDLFLITDSDKPDKFDTGKLSIDKGEKLNLSLKAAGGFAATLTN
jgi:hypothetical protein